MTFEFGKTIDEDVVEQILSILPPKSLKRFQCVSKRWYALITSPRFVAKHLSNSTHNNLSTSVLMKREVRKDTNPDETEELFSFLHFQNDEDNDVDSVHDEQIFLSSIQEFHIPFPTGVKTPNDSLIIIGHCNGIICLAQAVSGEVILCNPAIHEYKLLPPSPHLPDSDWPCSPLFRFRDGLGFGHDPNFNVYKVINIGFPAPELSTPDGFNIYNPPKAAVYTLGTDAWRKIKTDSLETETTILWPEQFQMHFKDMCFWQGHEQHKELDVLDDYEEQFIREVIIMFDTGDELFHNIMLPDEFDYPSKNYFFVSLLVWKDSVALLGRQFCQLSSYGIWVIDEFGGHNGGAWTKHITFDLHVEPLIFWKSDEVLLNDPYDTDYSGLIFSYNLGTKNLKNLPIRSERTDSTAIVYVSSIVSVLGGSKPKSKDNSTPIAEFSVFEYPSPPVSHYMVDKKTYSYSVWAIPSDDVSLRIKKVMEGLRTEFGGPEIDPHIAVVGSIRMKHEDMLNKFRSLQSDVISSYKAKVNQVVTRSSYFQCISLLIHSSFKVSPELSFTTGVCGGRFHFCNEVRPHLSLLYGYLTEEERKKAQEKVSYLDEGLSSLSFFITRLALYKIDYKDRSLKSWEKIADYPLQFE
ncbi:uncharacterized protein LOC133720166 [Rosa rugosa]|uniref:uncharacterized protein LOC133720166 n=1 Tax=Rosa rugosa TaxID=74645 RepID=UPI002B413331|nr:uncharacterized protein LOC133720166 [Rosa rugosa]